MPRLLSSLLLMFIGLLAGHHCCIEQMMGVAETPNAPTKECGCHKSAEYSSHDQGGGSHDECAYCRVASVAILAQFKKIEITSDLVSFPPLPVTASFPSPSQQILPDITVGESGFILNLVSSLALAANAPPGIFC